MVSHSAQHRVALEPSSDLARELIQAYVAGAHHEARALVAHNEFELQRILADASHYASSRLHDIEERQSYCRSLPNET